MGRMFIDCREFPSEKGCTVAICADNDTELLEAAIQHAVAVHGHQDSAELRQQIKALFKSGTAPLHAPAQKAA
jgi:predicted small metal-binding protein